MRLGITIPFEPFQNRHIVDLVRVADRCGYTDAWSFESFSTDGFTPLAAAAMISERMRLGTAIIPVFTRPPALIAMSAATINQMSAGRYVLGLGISTPNIVQQWMGIPFEHPHPRLRETVAAIRAIFRGEKVTLTGKTVRINGFRLDMTLDVPPPPIYIGAQGSRMLRLAGELGDGLIVNFITAEMLPGMLEYTRAGMRAVGKDPSNLDVVCRIIVAADEDETVARSMLRRSLTAYLTVPQYNRFFSEMGYANEAGTAMELWQRGERKQAVESIPDRMLEAIYVIGDAKRCRQRIDEFIRAGVTTTALQFVSFAQTAEERRSRILRAIENVARAG
jgi:probable F420-dependent oxidoreductase